MKTFEFYLDENFGGGGSAAGRLEIVKTSLERARAYSQTSFAKYGRIFDIELPNHDESFAVAKYRAMLGHTKRKDMPVIGANDVKALQTALKSGSLDHEGPFSNSTNIKNPFPEGLSGKEAQEFFKAGLEINDGAVTDDKVKIKRTKVAVSKLVPIQQQIYYDKSIDKIAETGAKSSKKFHQKTIFVISSDFRIIDGHHRFLSALLVDHNQKVNTLMVDMPIDKLLPLAISFGDARGNKRNK